MGIVFFYAVLGGMKGITYTQVVQYCVLIFAYLVPAIFISLLMTDTLIPQLGFGGTLSDGSGRFLLDRLDELSRELGFATYTSGTKGNAGYSLYHPRPDGWHRRPAPCDRAVLHRREGLGGTQLGWMGPGLHRAPLHRRTGGRGFRPYQSARDRLQHPLRGRSGVVQQMGGPQG